MTPLSVIIVTYNSARDIIGCISSLSDSGMPVQEIVVVDNASTDETCTIVAHEFPAVRLVRNSSNRGFGSAVNSVIADIPGELVLLLNPDSRILSPFYDGVTSCFAADPKLGIAGIRLADESGRPRRSAWKTPSLVTVACESLLPYSWSQKLTTVRPAKSGPAEIVSGACMVLRTTMFRALGGFDPAFFLYYEDTDLCLRARLAGYHVCYLAEGNVYHREGGSFAAYGIDSLRPLFRSRLRYCRKHYSPIGRRAAQLLIFAGLVIRYSAHGAAGILGAGTWFRQSSLAHREVLRSFPVLLREASAGGTTGGSSPA